MANDQFDPSRPLGVGRIQYGDFFDPVGVDPASLSRRINAGSIQDTTAAATAAAILASKHKYPGAFITTADTKQYTVSSSTNPLAKIPETEMRKARSDIMLKLLEIERTRCLSKKDEEERTEGLAGLLEGDDMFLARIEQGLDKYLSLMFGDYVKPQAVAVQTQQASVIPDVRALHEVWRIINQGIVKPSSWSVRQHQTSINQREGSHRIMIELSTGPVAED